MNKNLTYLILFIVTLLLQAFLFDNLTISVYLNPLIYILFIALLPLEIPRGTLLFAGLASGVAADWFMGAAGINTIATVFIAFVRPMVLNVLFGKENIRDGGVPSPERFGVFGFLRYMLIIVLLHHLLFFVLESLSWAHMLQTLIRLVVSGVVTIGCGWLVAPMLLPNHSRRI